MKKLEQNQEKAITLISLVITIIVLLILSGIVLNFVLGKNGIIQKAGYAKGEYGNSVNVEKNILNQYSAYIEENIEDDKDENNQIDKPQENKELQEFKTKIASTITELGIKTSSTQSTEDIISNINKMASKNYEEGKESDLVLVQTDLSSRYVQTISLSNIESYENLTKEDVIIVNKYMTYANTNDGEGYYTISKTYDNQTGTLTLGKLKSYNTKWTFWNVYDLYIIKRKPKTIQTREVTKVLETDNTENIDLLQFKTKLAEAFKNYGIENSEENSIIDKTAEEMSNDLKRIARKKYEEGIATYMVLVQENLSSRYAQTASADNIDQYQNFTIDKFLIVNKSLAYASGSDGENILTMTKSYNPSTGQLSFGKQKSYTNDKNSYWTFYNTYDVYALKKEILQSN